MYDFTYRHIRRLILALLATAALPASGVVIYSQDEPALVNGAAIRGLATADDFVLAFDAELQAVTFWTLEGPAANWDNLLRYKLWNDVASGISSPAEESMRPSDFSIAGAELSRTNPSDTLTRVPTGQFVDIEGITYTEYEYAFELASTVSLQANTPYWLSLELGGSGDILWQDNSVNVGRYVWQGVATTEPTTWFPASVTDNPVSVAFRLEGVVPAPSTLLLVLTCLGVFRLSRRSQTQR
jgi:hypothetical protein